MKKRKKMVMYVYNDISTDARVQRAANALASDFDLTLVSARKGKVLEDNGYKNVLAGGYSSTAMDILATICTTWKLIKQLRPDIVYCHDYYSAILIYLLLHTRYSGKIIYDAHELMIPENGKTDKRLRFFYWFEKRIVNKVDLVVCASEPRGKIMFKHYGLKEMPIVVPNISQLEIDDDDAATMNILASLDNFFKHEVLTVVYAGVVTTSRCINELFDAVVVLADKCKLLIVGDGDALDFIKQKSVEHPELTAFFTGQIPYKSLGSILSRCDVGFVYYPTDTQNNVYCASNKIFEYASVGLPMLANENPTVKMILKESQIGIATSDFKQGLQLLFDKRASFKENCSTFMKNNQWGEVEENLLQKISNLFE